MATLCHSCQLSGSKLDLIAVIGLKKLFLLRQAFKLIFSNPFLMSAAPVSQLKDHQPFLMWIQEPRC